MRVAEELAMEGRAEEYITAFLTDKNKPVSFTEIAKFYDSETYHVSTIALRRACWYLMDKGKIEFDEQNHLRIRV